MDNPERRIVDLYIFYKYILAAVELYHAWAQVISLSEYAFVYRDGIDTHLTQAIQDGWRIGQATENVIIHNCHFARWAITIGSEMSGGVRNIFIEDCKIDSCRNGIYFKSNLDRGGYFENLNMRRIEADVCLWGVINFRTNYHGYRGGNHPTLFRNICIEDVTCNRVDSVALMANGLPEAKLYNITLRNIKVKQAPKAIQMDNVVNLTLDNVEVDGRQITSAEQED